jgi:hypothetical protein
MLFIFFMVEIKISLYGTIYEAVKEKYAKERAPPQLGLRLPSQERFFRRGQKLACPFVQMRYASSAHTVCPRLPKKPPLLGCAARGWARVSVQLFRQTENLAIEN